MVYLMHICIGIQQIQGLKLDYRNFRAKYTYGVIFKDEKKYEEIKRIGKKGELIQRQYVKYIRTELGFEAILQIAGQIILLLQARTSSSTVSGLETVFGKSSSIGIDVDTIIIFSILPISTNYQDGINKSSESHKQSHH